MWQRKVANQNKSFKCYQQKKYRASINDILRDFGTTIKTLIDIHIHHYLKKFAQIQYINFSKDNKLAATNSINIVM